MDYFNIYKFKNIDINNLNITDFDIKYDSNEFLIQGPIFNNYEILNYNSKKYIDLKLDNTRLSHLKFLTFVDSLELKLNNYSNYKSIKTQIITDIQNKKSLKVKLLDDTIFFDNNKTIIKNLYSKKISLLFKLEFFKHYYSWTVIQILQLN